MGGRPSERPHRKNSTTNVLKIDERVNGIDTWMKCFKIQRNKNKVKYQLMLECLVHVTANYMVKGLGLIEIYSCLSLFF